MRFIFNNEELAYLNEKMVHLASAVKQPQFADVQDQHFFKTVWKMKNKFTPNASLVFLGGKERRLIYQMLDYRMRMLADLLDSGQEMEILSRILDKLIKNEPEEEKK